MSAESPLSRPRRAAQRGLSLVELMVGIVVALLVSLAAAGSAQMFTASQRQGISVGGGSANALAALGAIKNDIAQVGLGFFGDSRYLCNTLNLSVAATSLSNGAAFAPVQVTRTDGQDVIDVVYGSRIESGTNVLLNVASDGTAATLMSLLPASVGQAVLLAPESPGTVCTVRSITALALPSATALQTLTFGNTGAHNQLGFANAPNYAARARVTLLGTLQWNRYRLEAGNLVMDQRLGGTSAVLLRNVLALRAEYGTSNGVANNNTLEGWHDAGEADWTSLSSANITRVRAMRMGLVLRSGQAEKAEASTGECTASLTKPTLFGETIEPDVTDWKCYRYRTLTMLVPLRNVMMGLK